MRAFRGTDAPAEHVRAADRADAAWHLIARMSRAHLSGRVAERATHAISNHLQVALGNAELLSLAATLPESSRRQLASIMEAGRDAAATNAALRALARDDDHSGELAATSLSLGDALTRSSSALEWLASPARLDTGAIGTAARTLRLSTAAPPALLCELLLRLVHHAPATAGDTLSLHAEPLAPGPWLRLGVRIDGPSEGVSGGSSDGPRAAVPPEGDEALSLEVLAALVALAGGRFDLADGEDGPVRSPPDLLLPVRRGDSDP